MTTSYTKISKPTTAYSNVQNAFISYDDASISYDDASVYYDGLHNQSPYTNILKASGTSYTKIPKAT